MKLLSKLNLFIVWRRMKTYINNILEGLDITGAEAKEQKWSNSSPSSTYGANTVSVDLSEYDEIEIEYRPFNGYSQTKRVRCKVGAGAVMDMVMSNAGLTEGSTVFAGFRLVSATKSAVVFDTAYSYVDPDTRLCIPTAIYGIRKVKGVVKEAEWTPADWVVERGTKATTLNGVTTTWEYKKMNSGECECWCTTATGNAYVGTAWGGIYTCDDAIPSVMLPFEFAEFKVFPTPIRGNGNYWLFTNNSAPAANCTPRYGAARGTSHTGLYVSANLYVKGTLA